jgi:hypothetical protein
MKMKRALLSLAIAVFLMLPGCAEKPVGTGEKSMQPQETFQLSPAEQKAQAYKIFEQIKELSDSEDRQKNLSEIKKLYRKIIDNYSEIGLAQESYLRLILIAKEENTASGDAEAEKLYQEFLGKYPESRLRRVMENEARSTR